MKNRRFTHNLYIGGGIQNAIFNHQAGGYGSWTPAHPIAEDAL